MSTYKPSLFDLPMADTPDHIGSATVRAIDSLHLLNPGRGRVSGCDYTLNPYRGCSFGCSYCYAPFFEPDEDKRAAWGQWVEVKNRAIEALTKVDLRGKLILMSSVTDPYQPIELKLRLTREIVEHLMRCDAHLIVQTRSPVVARDIDLLQGFSDVQVNISVPTDDDEIRKRYEPNCASIERRLRTAEKLVKAGLSVRICVSPMIPMRDPAGFGRRLTEIGVRYAHATWFHHSTRPFSSNTRDLAIALNKEFEWTEDRFLAAREQFYGACSGISMGWKRYEEDAA